VRTYGIDGFRCDTVKHVEPEAWSELKRAATAALTAWKTAHPSQKIDDAPFWMVGEYWGHGPARGPLHDAGFDAMINFELQQKLMTLVMSDAGELDALFTEYAGMQHGKPAQLLNYISSHDTQLFDRTHLIEAGTALLLAPGGAQIFYGDETARPPGPEPASDRQQATRSDMNWDHIDQAVLAHWRALGTFRARHVALARGIHARLAKSHPYVFSRVDAERGDRVVVALDVPAGGAVPVAPVFADGQAVRDAYTGKAYVVAAGKVAIAGGGRVALLEVAP